MATLTSTRRSKKHSISLCFGGVIQKFVHGNLYQVVAFLLYQNFMSSFSLDQLTRVLYMDSI